MEIEKFIREYLRVNNKSISIDQAIMYFLDFSSKYRRKSTIQFYKDHLKPFKEFCYQYGVDSVMQLNNEIIEKYVRYLKRINNQNITINKRVALVSYVINFCYDNNYIGTNKLFKVPKLEVVRKELFVISDDELERLKNYALSMDIQRQLIVLLLITTGIRRNELVNVLKRNIDIKNHRIYLEYTKTNSPRYIFFDNYVSKLITCNLSNNKTPYLFANNDRQLSPSFITQLLWYIGIKINIQHLTPHRLRHKYATCLLKNGANIEEVRRLLGHSDYKMTKRYLDYIDTDLQQANYKYNPINLESVELQLVEDPRERKKNRNTVSRKNKE